MRRAVVVAMVLVAGGSALAEEPELYAEAGDWQILINAETNGCFARTGFEDGLIIEIGVDPVKDGGYFGAYNPAWDAINEGAKGEVSFDFGDSRFAGEIVGVVREGVPGGYAFFDNPAFVTEFTKRHSVAVSGDGGAKFDVDLAGTTKAVQAVLDCQEKQPDPPAE